MALQTVVALLQASRSVSDSTRKPAEQQIMQYFDQPGFGMFLCNIIATRDGSLNEAIRILASTHLMSLCTTRWAAPRKPVQNLRVIPDAEKVELRGAIVQLLSDPSVSIANIMTATIARVVKHDFPDVWGGIFAELCGAIATQSTVSVQNRLLMTLRACCKIITELVHQPEYDSFNMDHITQEYDKKRNTLKSQAASIFAAVVPIWTNAGQRFLQMLSQGDSSAAAIDTSNQCLHAAKVLYTLMVEYMTDFTVENPSAVMSFFQDVHGALGTFLNIRTATPNPTYPLMPGVEKIFLRLVKLVADAQDENRYAFIPLLKPFLDFFYPIVSSPPAGELSGFIEKVIVKAIRFYGVVASSREYTDDIEEFLKYESRSPKKLQADVASLEAARQVMSQHFTTDVVSTLTRVAVSRYMILKEEDLEKWDSDPEEFLHDELSDAFQYTIIAAGEFLFIRMLYYNGPTVGPVVSEIVQHAVAQCNVANPPLDAILLKDAAYYAVSLGETALSSAIEFGQMFNGQLAIDAANPDPRYRLIRRRIASIISFWTWHIPAELTTTVYELCVQLLTEEDKIVRIHGAIAVRHLLENTEVDYGTFTPFLQRTVEAVVRLVHDMKESNLSSNVLEILASIIEHFGRQIAPFAQVLLGFMFKLWEECGVSRALTKQTILRVLSKLLEALPSQDATSLQIMFVPLIEYCIRSQSAMDQLSGTPTKSRKKKDSILTSPEQDADDAEYLLEDGVAMWLTLTQQCQNMTMDLAKLFDYVPNIARTFQGQAPQMGCLALIQSYICVGGPEFLTAYIGTVVSVLELILSTSKPGSAKKTLEAISLFVQLYPQHAPPYLPTLLKRTMAICLDTKDNLLLEATAGTVLARLPLLNKEYFFQFLNEHVVGTAQPPIIMLIEFWCRRASVLDYLQDMKVWVSSLSCLLVTQDNAILSVCARMVETCVSLLTKIRSKEVDPSMYRDSLRQRDTRIVSGSNFEKVLKLADKRDVGSLPYNEVQTFFIDRLRECIQLNGSQVEAHIFATVSAQTRTWLQSPPAPLAPKHTHKITIIEDDE